MQENNPYQAPQASFNASSDQEDWDLTPVWSPAGRFGRLSYLAWNGVTYFIFSILMAAFAPIILPEGTELSLEYLIESGVTSFLFLSLPLQAVYMLFSVRRLHDMNASGWWVLFSLVPLANAILALALMFIAGNEGSNDFGPPRETQAWEKILAFLYIGFITLSVVTVVAVLGMLASNGLAVG